MALDYASNAALYLPRDMPDPQDSAFPEAVAGELRELLPITSGRAFVLFTGENSPFHYWDAREGNRSAWYPSVEVVTGPGEAWEPLVQAVARRLGELPRVHRGTTGDWPQFHRRRDGPKRPACDHARRRLLATTVRWIARRAGKGRAAGSGRGSG